MDRETEEWYDNQFVMFSNTGWKDLMKQASELFDSYNDLRRIDNEDKFQYVKGQLDILSWLLQWETKVESTYKELKDASADL